MQLMEPEIDDYSTCAGSYATLRIYHESETPDKVTRLLEVNPSSTQNIGDVYEASNTKRTTKLSGWFLTTETDVSSYDLTKHLDFLLNKLAGKEPLLHSLLEQGWRADIACMWDSAYGHGGPTFSPALLKKLSDFGIEIWLDIYFHGAYELLEKEKKIWGGR